jgi:hypothetical protein
MTPLSGFAETAPARTPTRPPIQDMLEGGRVGVRAGTARKGV